LYTISEVKLILTHPLLLPKVRGAVEDAAMPTSQVLMFNTDLPHHTDGFESWEKLLEHGESDWVSFDDETLAKNTVAALMATSGTTGLPKAAQSSHYSQVAQSVLLFEKEKPYEVCSIVVARRY
jgi:acyl-coenzyme A synthetase/AMP-(fatty) acid ligase